MSEGVRVARALGSSEGVQEGAGARSKDPEVVPLLLSRGQHYAFPQDPHSLDIRPAALELTLVLSNLVISQHAHLAALAATTINPLTGAFSAQRSALLCSCFSSLDV